MAKWVKVHEQVSCLSADCRIHAISTATQRGVSLADLKDSLSDIQPESGDPRLAFRMSLEQHMINDMF